MAPKMADFDMLRELGRGSCGVVWLVRRHRDKRLYAMKAVALAAQTDGDDKALKERAQAEREVEILKGIDSPHVVRYAGLLLQPATPSKRQCRSELNILTEYCNRGDLASFIRRARVGIENRLPEDRVWKLAAAILAGLNALHRQQILHRDLKPANVFLQLDGGREVESAAPNDAKSLLAELPKLTVKVGDLGMARMLSNADSLASTLVGTPYYCAPEVFNGDAYGVKADVYSFGACIWEAIHGKAPYADIRNIAALVNKLLHLTGDGEGADGGPAVDPSYPVELRNFVQSCLRRFPEDRPSTGDLLLKVALPAVAPAASPRRQVEQCSQRAKTPSPQMKGRPKTPGASRAQTASPRGRVERCGSPVHVPPPASIQGKPAAPPAPKPVAGSDSGFKFQPMPRISRPRDASPKRSPSLPVRQQGSPTPLRRSSSANPCPRGVKQQNILSRQRSSPAPADHACGSDFQTLLQQQQEPQREHVDPDLRDQQHPLCQPKEETLGLLDAMLHDMSGASCSSRSSSSSSLALSETRETPLTMAFTDLIGAGQTESHSSSSRLKKGGSAAPVAAADMTLLPKDLKAEVQLDVTLRRPESASSQTGSEQPMAAEATLQPATLDLRSVSSPRSARSWSESPPAARGSAAEEEKPSSPITDHSRPQARQQAEGEEPCEVSELTLQRPSDLSPPSAASKDEGSLDCESSLSLAAEQAVGEQEDAVREAAAAVGGAGPAARQSRTATESTGTDRRSTGAEAVGVHSKRFLQENKWRGSAKGRVPLPMHGKFAAPREEVGDYVARAQECWLRWRQEKRQAAAASPMPADSTLVGAAPTVTGLEIRGVAFSPVARPRSVAAGACA